MEKQYGVFIHHLSTQHNPVAYSFLSMMFFLAINYLSTQPPWLVLFTSIGFLSLAKSSISFVKWIYATFFRPPKNLKKTYGSWALITGATDGIGRAFAFQLAKQGLNLALIGRNPEKLKSVSKEIQLKSPWTKIKTLEHDFTSAHMLSIEELIEDGIEVGILINNVGMTYPGASYFHEVDEKVWMDIVRVNLEGTTKVTRAVLPGMLQRGKGAIVNIGSGASVVVPSHPLYTIYAATKAYIDQLSRCLNMEYKHFGIDVQCQVPLYVATNMTSKVASIERPSFFVPSADGYAQAAIRCIGYEGRCAPYWAHSIQWFFSRLLPDSALDAWRLSIGIRRRGEVV